MNKPAHFIFMDSSALLANIFDEEGAEKVEPSLEEGFFMTTVNIAEVMTKLLRENYMPEEIALLRNLRMTPIVITMEIAKAAAELDTITQKFGLSLGDRCCIAAALQYPGSIVLTADKSWKKLPFDKITVRLIR